MTRPYKVFVQVGVIDSWRTDQFETVFCRMLAKISGSLL